MMLPGMAQKFLMQKQSETIRIGGRLVPQIFFYMSTKKNLEKKEILEDSHLPNMEAPLYRLTDTKIPLYSARFNFQWD